jgi:ATP-dependent DNA ligase
VHGAQTPTSAAVEIAAAMRCRSAVIDGEICCLDGDGRSNFYRLMFRRGHPHFYPSMCSTLTAMI